MLQSCHLHPEGAGEEAKEASELVPWSHSQIQLQGGPMPPALPEGLPEAMWPLQGSRGEDKTRRALLGPNSRGGHRAHQRVARVPGTVFWLPKTISKSRPKRAIRHTRIITSGIARESPRGKV